MNSSAGSANHGDARTITLVVTMEVKPEHEAGFLAFAREFATLVHANEPDVLVYALTKHPTRDSTYVWIERYRDEATLRNHGQTSYMAEVRPKLQAWLVGAEALRLEQVIPG